MGSEAAQISVADLLKCSCGDHGYGIRTRFDFFFAGDIAQIPGGLVNRAGSDVIRLAVRHGRPEVRYAELYGERSGKSRLRGPLRIFWTLANAILKT